MQGSRTVLARIVLPSTGLRELWDALASRVPSTEVVAAHQWFDSLHPRQCLRKQGQHLLVQQSLPVLPEAGVLPDGIVCSKSHKPSVQHVVVQLFRQQSLGTQAVDGLQQQHPSPTARVGWTDDQRRRTTVTRLVQTLQCLIAREPAAADASQEASSLSTPRRTGTSAPPDAPSTRRQVDSSYATTRTSPTAS